MVVTVLRWIAAGIVAVAESEARLANFPLDHRLQMAKPALSIASAARLASAPLPPLDLARNAGLVQRRGLGPGSTHRHLVKWRRQQRRGRSVEAEEAEHVGQVVVEVAQRVVAALEQLDAGAGIARALISRHDSTSSPLAMTAK